MLRSFDAYRRRAARGDVRENRQNVQLRSRLSASVSRVAARIRSQSSAIARRARRRGRARARSREPVVERVQQRSKASPAARPPTASASLWIVRGVGVAATARSPRRSARRAPAGVRDRAALSASRTEPSARAAAAPRRGRIDAAPGGAEAGDRLARSRPASGVRAAAAGSASGSSAAPAPGRCATIRNSERGGGSSIIFNKRVGAGAIEVVGAVDDGDAPAAEAPPTCGTAATRRARPRRGFRYRSSSTCGFQFAPQQREIRMRQRRRAAARPDGRARRARSRAARAGAARRVGMGEHEAREAPGERRLADALRPADQPGVGEPSARDRRRASRFGGRRGRPGASAKRGCGAPAKASLSGGASSASARSHCARAATFERARPRRVSHRRPRSPPRPRLRAGRASMTTQRSRLGARDRQKGPPQASRGRRAPSRSKRSAAASPRRAAARARPSSGRQVEHQREVGPDSRRPRRARGWRSDAGSSLPAAP